MIPRALGWQKYMG